MVHVPVPALDWLEADPGREHSASEARASRGREVGGRVFIELGALRNLGALGLVGAVAKDVAATGVRIVEQRKESLAAELRAALGLAVVLELEQPAHDLLFASFLHVSRLERGEAGIDSRLARSRWREFHDRDLPALLSRLPRSRRTSCSWRSAITRCRSKRFATRSRRSVCTTS